MKFPLINMHLNGFAFFVVLVFSACSENKKSLGNTQASDNALRGKASTVGTKSSISGESSNARKASKTNPQSDVGPLDDVGSDPTLQQDAKVLIKNLCQNDTDCDDENVCSRDRCDPDSGECEHTNLLRPDDASTALCQGGSAVDVQCVTDDNCEAFQDPTQPCLVKLCIENICEISDFYCECESSADCLDGRACGEDRTCQPGEPISCQSGSQCYDNNRCTAVFCDSEVEQCKWYPELLFNRSYCDGTQEVPVCLDASDCENSQDPNFLCSLNECIEGLCRSDYSTCDCTQKSDCALAETDATCSGFECNNLTHSDCMETSCRFGQCVPDYKEGTLCSTTDYDGYCTKLGQCQSPQSGGGCGCGSGGSILF